ncbi:MAG: hypothetical protein HC893_01040 [Chloroflexaceae bacterium]|nr:hypothetical protein [Chloroflexaceae bacterium]
MLRSNYIYRLESLRAELLQLGTAVEESMARAIRSLHTHNTAVALWVINNDNYIDEARDTLETRVVTLLATQQPIVAGDLRLLMVTTAIANELERIADYASGIAGRFYRRPELMAQFTLPEQFCRMPNRCATVSTSACRHFLQ